VVKASQTEDDFISFEILWRPLSSLLFGSRGQQFLKIDFSLESILESRAGAAV
jgi:hypothetical protein